MSDGHYSSDRRRRTPPLQYRAVPISQIPPPEGYLGTGGSDWTEARRTWERGDALAFKVPASAVIELWQTALAQLGPVALRYSHKRGEACIYPWEGARAYRARADQSVTPDELSRMHAQAARLRADAVIRFVLSDALHHVADKVQRGMSRDDAFAQFVASRGTGGYPIGFDAGTFEGWLDALSADADLAVALGRSPSPAESDGQKPPPNRGKP